MLSPLSLRLHRFLSIDGHGHHAHEALRRAKGFTKFNRADFMKLRQEKRVVPDGVNAKFLSCHGPLVNRQPGSAFLPATY
ncbi:unnamed protein product [Brassica rapa]|uniref:Uncharacterized protein n=1 Tax=Brassica campestris TaxID=3711 RepID=A0A3P6DB43_BRACM|nr:unnamed protein product [Brassica rapa]VDD16409.1 unnamed protein product [Brassica rapa]